MASEHLMKVSLASLMVAAHTPFLVVDLRIVHIAQLLSAFCSHRSPAKCC